MHDKYFKTKEENGLTFLFEHGQGASFEHRRAQIKKVELKKKNLQNKSQMLNTNNINNTCNQKNIVIKSKNQRKIFAKCCYIRNKMV